MPNNAINSGVQKRRFALLFCRLWRTLAIYSYAHIYRRKYLNKFFEIKPGRLSELEKLISVINGKSNTLAT